MRYLFLGAHTDEELCFAGTMIKLIKQGHDVTQLSLSKCGSQELEHEAFQAENIIGHDLFIGSFEVRRFDNQRLADYLYKKWNTFDFIFTHDTSDRHPDHRIVAEESLRVFNCNLATYIGPWNGNENPNYFVELSQEQLDRKIAALACYKSQAHRKYMDPDFIRGWAVYNGIKCNKRYAEAFRIVKLIS